LQDLMTNHFKEGEDDGIHLNNLNQRIKMINS